VIRLLVQGRMGSMFQFRMKFQSLLSSFFILAFSSIARADYIEAGAQYICDQKTNLFDLRPYQQTSEGDSKILPDYKVLKGGVSKISCQIGGHSFSTEINIVPPRNGMCMGGGDVVINKMQVDGSEISKRLDFDRGCFLNEPVIVHIQVGAKDRKIFLQKCSTTEYTWDPTQAPFSCEDTEIKPVSHR
jgi:hypothetical protein